MVIGGIYIILTSFILSIVLFALFISSIDFFSFKLIFERLKDSTSVKISLSLSRSKLLLSLICSLNLSTNSFNTLRTVLIADISSSSSFIFFWNILSICDKSLFSKIKAICFNGIISFLRIIICCRRLIASSS